MSEIIHRQNQLRSLKCTEISFNLGVTLNFSTRPLTFNAAFTRTVGYDTNQCFEKLWQSLASIASAIAINSLLILSQFAILDVFHKVNDSSTTVITEELSVNNNNWNKVLVAMALVSFQKLTFNSSCLSLYMGNPCRCSRIVKLVFFPYDALFPPNVALFHSGMSSLANPIPRMSCAKTGLIPSTKNIMYKS